MKFNRHSYGHKSYHSSFNGILNYIQSNHSDSIPKTKDVNQYFSKVKKLMRRFLRERKLKIKDNNSDGAGDFNANVIQNNFDAFKEFLNNY
jgi:hypothetical protein